MRFIRHLREHERKLCFTGKDKITDIGKLVQKHLQSLLIFEKLFLLGNLNGFDYILIRNFFMVDPKFLPHSLQNKLVEFSNHSTVKNIFESSSLQKFWLSMVKLYPLVSKNGWKVVCSFHQLTVVNQVSQLCVWWKTRFALGFQSNLTYACAFLKHFQELFSCEAKPYVHPYY